MTAPALTPLRARVARERSRLRGLVVAAGAGAGLAAAAVLLAGGVAMLAGARWMSLPRGSPFAVWVLAVGAAVAALLATRRVARRESSEAAVAAAVERERRLRAGSLTGALEVAGQGALARHAEERLARELDARPGALAPELQRRHARAGAVALAGAAVALALLVLSASGARDGWAALAHPVRAWRGTLLPPLRLVDLPPAVLRGESLDVRVDAPGRRNVVVRHRATGGAWSETRLAVEDGRASLALPSLDADVVIVATDGRARSDTARIAVTDRPYLGDVVVTARFPAYLDRAPEQLVLGEPARVPRGTELRVEGGATTELRSVALASGADTLRLAVDGRRFAGRVIAERDGRWEWSAVGRGGDVPHVPAALVLSVVPDLAPRVELLAPARDTLVLPNARVQLSLLVTDDHGLGDVVVRSWRRRTGGASDPETTTRLPVDGGMPQWAGAAMLDLSGRDLQPGDELRVVVSATDRSPWRQTGASRELVLRVPSLAEQRASARDAANAAVARAMETAASQRALAQRTTDASRARDRSAANRRAGQSGAEGSEASLSYESAERARTLASEQRELTEQVRQMQQQARELERQLSQAGAMDEELRERLREAQRLMQEALTPRLAEQLQKLEQAAQQLDPERTQRALADLAEQQRQLREQLERSAEMLRRAALEGTMETLRDEARELAAEQRRLADSLASAPARPEPPRGVEQQAQETQPRDPAADVRSRTEQLTREVEELTKRLEQQKAEAGASRTREAQRHAEASAQELRRRETASESPEQQSAAREPQPDERRQGEQQGQQQQGQQQGQQAGAQQQGAQQQGAQQQGAQERSGQQLGQQNRGAGERQGSGADAARRAAGEMDRAAEQLAAARSDQVGEWKQELTSEIDRSINELTQMAREQSQLGQQAQGGTQPDELRAQQSALQQGVQRTGQRLQEAGKTSSLLSERSQQAVSQAQQQVAQASRQLQQAAGQQSASGTPSPAGRQQAAESMQQAAEALNQAAASLVRDRARANASNSATGFPEMMQRLQELAQQQGAINQQAAGLMPGGPGNRPGAAAMEQARQLGRQQRAVANELEELGNSDRTGTADAMADEARQLARALEGGAVDPNTVNRQQRLFRRMLDAGLTLEQDEIDEEAPRRGETARTTELFTPRADDVEGRAATRYRIPTWDELRGLSAEERRLVLEYFRRLNAEAQASPPPAAAPPER